MHILQRRASCWVLCTVSLVLHTGWGVDRTGTLSDEQADSVSSRAPGPGSGSHGGTQAQPSCVWPGWGRKH